MFWRDPQFWADLAQIAPLIIILLASCAGSYSSFTKDRQFNCIQYLFEVGTAIVAGYVTYLLCTFAHANQEIAIAFTIVGSYFGNQMLPIFYQISIAKIKRMLDSDAETKDKGGKDA